MGHSGDTAGAPWGQDPAHDAATTGVSRVRHLRQFAAGTDWRELSQAAQPSARVVDRPGEPSESQASPTEDRSADPGP